MSLVVFTALVGLVIAPVHLHRSSLHLDPVHCEVGAGASGALNMCTRRHRRPDGRAPPTADPRGRITRRKRSAFGMTLAFFS